MTNEFLSRQELLIDTDRIESLSVLIVGVGGIGSNAAYQLASMGVKKMMLIDPDDIEEGNVFPGAFHMQDIGQRKAEAISRRLHQQFGREEFEVSFLTTEIEMVNLPKQDRFDVILACTDDIPSRKQAWEKWHDQCDLWVDARMGGTLAHVLSVHPTDEMEAQWYAEDMLYDEEEELACGEKATSALTKGMIPGMIATVVRSHIMEMPVNRVQRFDLDDGIYATT